MSVWSMEMSANLKGEWTTQHHLGKLSVILSFFNGESPFFNWGATGSPLTLYMRSFSYVTETFCVIPEYLPTWF